MEVQHPRCPFCHAGVRPEDDKAACDRCMSWQHRGCWTEHGSCAACAGTTRLEPTRAPDEGAPARSDLHAAQARLRSLPPFRPAQLQGPCPRCALGLAESSYEGHPVSYCQGCWGYWAPIASCVNIAVSRDEQFSLEERQTVLGQVYEYFGEIERTLRCPNCKALMRGWQVRGLLLYRCVDDGLWFDPGDLKRLQILVEADRAALDLFLRELGI